MKQRRKKAWVGAAIGAVANIAGSLISAHQQRKQWREQQKYQNEMDTLQGAQNLSAAYANQDYVKDFEDKARYKNGGQIEYAKRKKALLGFGQKNSYGQSVIQNQTHMTRDDNGNVVDRNNYSPQTSGGNGGFSWSKQDTADTISAVGQLGSTLINAFAGGNKIIRSNVPQIAPRNSLQHAKMGCAFKRK